MKKIVTIGGGTGHYTLLRGLKNYDIELTSVVGVFDNSGSSGKIREELVDFGILPPGDIRNCLLALTEESKLKHTVNLFNYRFPSKGNLANHNLGNLILTAAQNLYGAGEGIKIISEMLEIKGNVLPISLDSTNIYAKTEEGKLLKGQIEVSYPEKNEKIKEIWLNPPAFIYKETANILRNADLIVISPGDLYGSIIPNFLVKGVIDLIKDKKIIYVCNLVTKQGTYGFRARDFVQEIEKYIKRKIDYVICNIKKPEKRIVDKYKEEDSYFVEPDTTGINGEVIKDNLLVEQKLGDKTIARHHEQKTARLIMNLLE